MALVSTIDLCALHSTSKQFSNGIKSGSTTSSRYGRKLWEIPKYETASSKELEPIIPSPTIFETLEAKEQSDLLPSAAGCAVHLEFLAALYALRQRVLESEDLDKLFDIKLTKKTVTRKGVKVELKDATLMERRQVKWEKYVEVAVARFLAWWKTVPETVPITNGDGTQFNDTILPPLDVLMVWHSFLLNPRWFRRSCGDGKMILYKTDFPWPVIHRTLDLDDWSFSLPQAATELFKINTSLETDLFETFLGWSSYPRDVQNQLLESTRFSVAGCDLGAFSQIRVSDQNLLRCFGNARDGMAKDLNNAVLRQVSFVDKMWDKLWIRSPAVEGTIRRARGRYNNFLNLFKLYPNTMFVPTLDIDLVWHTHQCSPSQYHAATQHLAGKFVNHDDSIVQKKLDTGLEDTKRLYRMRFGQEYHICGCWDCEALQSAIEAAGKESKVEKIAKQVGDDVAYFRAVEVARRKKAPIPIRQNVYT